MSLQYWQNVGKPERRRFVALDRGYHGDTVGAMSVSGASPFNERFAPLLFRTYRAPSPYCYRCPEGREPENCAVECARPLGRLLEKHGREIAGIILEPLLMAAGGMIIYPPAYLDRAGELARKHGVHLILDEVATGFGRTGKMFACEHAQVQPDFLCLSKGITSGALPLGATLTTESIYRAFYADYAQRKTFYHGHTFTANPVACAAALASLRVFEEEDTLARARRLLPQFRDGLERFRSLPIVGDVRQIGLIGAVELVKDRRTKEPFGVRERVGLKVYREGLKRNLVLRPLEHIVYLFLPLCVREGELRFILDNTYAAVAAQSCGKRGKIS